MSPAAIAPAAIARAGCRVGWRVWSLGGAIVLYGLLSAPAPPVVRGVELAVGLLLVLAVGVRRPLVIATGGLAAAGWAAGWERVGAPAFLWLFWAPLVRGVWLGWEAGDMLRDVIPLLYLFLPLLAARVLRRAGGWAVSVLAGALGLAGLLFALRWWRHADWGFGAVGVRAMADGNLYYLNAPAVLFAAVGLPALALALVARGGWWRWAAAVPLAGGGALCLAALAGAVHRMALAIAALALITLALRCARRAPRAMLALVVVGGVAVFGLAGPLAGAAVQVAEKNRLAGANARWEEAAAAVGQATESTGTLLFGVGWGGLLANPAVGGWRVSYTHTLASYTLVKAGAFGVCALAAWLGALAPAVLQALRACPPLALAVLAPLTVSLGAHTSFKYLDTGVLLTLLVLAGDGGSVRSPRPSCRRSAPSAHPCRTGVPGRPPLPC